MGVTAVVKKIEKRYRAGARMQMSVGIWPRNYTFSLRHLMSLLKDSLLCHSDSEQRKLRSFITHPNEEVCVPKLASSNVIVLL